MAEDTTAAITAEVRIGDVLDSKEAGDTVQVTVRRGGELQTVPVRLQWIE